MVWILFSFYLSKERIYHFSYFQVLGTERFKNQPVPFLQLIICVCILMLTPLPRVHRAQRSVRAPSDPKVTYIKGQLTASCTIHRPTDSLVSSHDTLEWAGGEDVNQPQTNFYSSRRVFHVENKG